MKKPILKVSESNHWAFTQFLIEMHSGKDTSVSWMRIMGTFIILDIMTVWTLACVFDDDCVVNWTLEDMPLGLAGVITAVLLGKVGQALANRCKETK